MISNIRLRELAGFNDRQAQIDALKESRVQLLAAHDLAISQAEKGLQIDEGFFSGMKAAFATALTGSKMASKAVAKRAAALSDNVKKIYLNEKAKIELKNLITGVKDIAGRFEKLEKDVPTLLAKDERVSEIVKVFADALETLENELVARAIPPEKVDPTMSEETIHELLQQFLSEESLLTGNAKSLFEFARKNHDSDIEVSSKQMEEPSFASLVKFLQAGKLTEKLKFTGKILVK